MPGEESIKARCIAPRFCYVIISIFSPDHLIHHAGVALNQLDHLGGNIFFNIVGDRDAVVAVHIHLDGGVHRLQQGFFVDPRQNKAGFIQRLGALGGGTDADCGERMAHAGEETAFFRQGSRIGDAAKSVHLQAVFCIQ